MGYIIFPLVGANVMLESMQPLKGLRDCLYWALGVHRIASNYFSTVIQVLLKIYPTKCKLRSGKVLYLHNRFELGLLIKGWDLDIDGEFAVIRANNAIVKMASANLGDSAPFLHEEYAWLKVAGRDVVDVGAYVGDSVLYFAVRGARSIIALEPFPQNFRILLKNISSSRVQSTIVAINAALSSSSGFTKVDPAKEVNAGDEIIVSTEGQSIPTLTLDDLLNTYNLEDPLLKMDCEGCEYDSLLGLSNESLRRFERIQVEYHRGPEPLIKRLQEVGFEVFHTGPTVFFNQHAINPKMLLGYIYAERK